MDANPPAGWYPDPDGSPQLRWWDGVDWTDDFTDDAEAGAAQPGSADATAYTPAPPPGVGTPGGFGPPGAPGPVAGGPVSTGSMPTGASPASGSRSAMPIVLGLVALLVVGLGGGIIWWVLRDGDEPPMVIETQGFETEQPPEPPPDPPPPEDPPPPPPEDPDDLDAIAARACAVIDQLIEVERIGFDDPQALTLLDDIEDELTRIESDVDALGASESQFEQAILATCPEQAELFLDAQGDADELRRACGEGDMEACDELFVISPAGSDDERFADTCGGLQPPDTGLWCVDAFGSGDGVGMAPPVASDPEFRPLIERCTDGDMVACDELFRATPAGSLEQMYGDTCGGRQPIGTGDWCVDAFGPRA